MNEENDLQKIFSIIEEHDIKPNGIPLGFPSENDVFIISPIEKLLRYIQETTVPETAKIQLELSDAKRLLFLFLGIEIKKEEYLIDGIKKLIQKLIFDDEYREKIKKNIQDRKSLV